MWSQPNRIRMKSIDWKQCEAFAFSTHRQKIAVTG